jgi:hypothetical protein
MAVVGILRARRWAYLNLILAGMRPGEVGQLECTDIVCDGENYCFDLRPYNARNGRVAPKDLRNLKTNASGHMVPIHPLLINLGLLDRMTELTRALEKRDCLQSVARSQKALASRPGLQGDLWAGEPATNHLSSTDYELLSSTAKDSLWWEHDEFCNGEALRRRHRSPGRRKSFTYLI